MAKGHSKPVSTVNEIAALNDKLPAVQEKPRRITHKIRAAVDALVHGDAKSITEAAKAAGLSRSHLSRELGKPHITAHLRDKVLRNLAINAARAGAVKVDLLDSQNEMVRDRASSFVLGLAGIKPDTGPTVSLNLHMQAGWVIDLSDRTPDKLIDVTPQVISHG